MQRIAITGSSGYYGRKLIEQIRSADPQVRVLGVDLAPPREAGPDEFKALDVRDAGLGQVLSEFAPDTIVHLAFAVNPTHNDRLMREINIGGSRNVFEAVERIQPARFLIASSATVFGAWPDNPVPIDEHQPVRGRPEFRYSTDKTELEGMIAEFAARHSTIAVSWVRPSIIYGRGVDNYLSRFLLYLPVVFLLDGHDVALQFVHEDDVAAATWEILKQNARGPFNIGPPNWVQLSDIARETGRRALYLPFWAARLATTIWWGLRLPLFDFPPALHYYLRYPWVVAPTRLERELGFRFKYSSRDALRELLKAKGKLAAERLAVDTNGDGREPVASA